MVAGEDEANESDEEFEEEEASKPVAAKVANGRAERMVRPETTYAAGDRAGAGTGLEPPSRCAQVKCES